MVFGPVAQANLQTVAPIVVPPPPPPVVDLTPGKPLFALSQDGSKLNVTVRIPTRAPLPDGANVTYPPLTSVVLAGSFGDGASPFDGLSGDQLAGTAQNLPSGTTQTLVLTDADQGSDKVVSFDIPDANMGQVFWLAGSVSDAGEAPATPPSA